MITDSNIRQTKGCSDVPLFYLKIIHKKICLKQNYKYICQTNLIRVL